MAAAAVAPSLTPEPTPRTPPDAGSGDVRGPSPSPSEDEMSLRSTPLNVEDVRLAQRVDTAEATEAPPPLAFHVPVSAEAEQGTWAREQLSGRLEDITRMLRRSVEHEFDLAERVLQAQHRSQLAAERAQAAARLQAVQSQLDCLRAEHEDLNLRFDQRVRQVKASFALMHKMRTSLTERFVITAAFQMWSGAAAAGKDEKVEDQLADCLRNRHLVSTPFSAWRQGTEKSRRKALLLKQKEEQDEVCDQMMQAAAQEKDALEQKVADLERRLAEEERQRALLQDNLKRVFMRGVCALNFEAMSLLQEGPAVGMSGSPPAEPIGAPPQAALAGSLPSAAAAAAAGPSTIPAPSPPMSAAAGATGLAAWGSHQQLYESQSSPRLSAAGGASLPRPSGSMLMNPETAKALGLPAHLATSLQSLADAKSAPPQPPQGIASATLDPNQPIEYARPAADGSSDEAVYSGRHIPDYQPPEPLALEGLPQYGDVAVGGESAREAPKPSSLGASTAPPPPWTLGGRGRAPAGGLGASVSGHSRQAQAPPSPAGSAAGAPKASRWQPSPQVRGCGGLSSPAGASTRLAFGTGVSSRPTSAGALGRKVA